MVPTGQWQGVRIGIVLNTSIALPFNTADKFVKTCHVLLCFFPHVESDVYFALCQIY